MPKSHISHALARAAKPSKVSKPAKLTTKPAGPQQTRLWLMYPSRLIQRPVVWELSQQFKVVTNIRQASVTGEIGIVSLELAGARTEIKAAIAWLEKMGVCVEPIEINVIES